MSKKLPLLLLASLFYLFSHSQNLHFGVTTDVSLTKMNAQGLSSKWQSGYNGGAFATIDLSKKWSLQPEVLYTLQNVQKADKFTIYYVSAGRSVSNTDISLRYISVPLLLNYHISHLFTLQAGPEYNLMVYSNDNLLKDDKSAFRKNEAGVNAGVQLTFSPAFSLFGNYYYGLTNSSNIDERYQWHSNQVRLGINIRVF